MAADMSRRRRPMRVVLPVVAVGGVNVLWYLRRADDARCIFFRTELLRCSVLDHPPLANHAPIQLLACQFLDVDTSRLLADLLRVLVTDASHRHTSAEAPCQTNIKVHFIHPDEAP